MGEVDEMQQPENHGQPHGEKEQQHGELETAASVCTIQKDGSAVMLGSLLPRGRRLDGEAPQRIRGRPDGRSYCPRAWRYILQPFGASATSRMVPTTFWVSPPSPATVS